MKNISYEDYKRLKEDNGDGPSSYHRPYQNINMEKGGSGSGNFSHEGRPGEVGGSSPEDRASGP